MTGGRPDRPGTGAPAIRVPRWVPVAALLVCVAGTGVAIYLTVEHFAGGTTLACPETGVVNCRKVTSSAESSLLGMPVAVLGLVFFLVMLAGNVPAAWRSGAAWLRSGRLALAALGTAFVLYLLYVELFRLNAICLWCTAVHVLTVVLFAIVGVGTALSPAGTRTARRAPGAGR